MPWKECSVMDERLRFVARLLDGEAMSEVCREFGISRKTGYKIYRPLQGAWARGAERPVAAAGALRQPAAGSDRRPDRRPQTRQAALGRPKDPGASDPSAGRRRARSGQEHDPRRAPPARSGQADRARRATGPPGRRSRWRPAPNELWCADFKGSSSSATETIATR